MALKGLSKGDRPRREQEATKDLPRDEATERKAQAFIDSAAGQGKRPTRTRVYERYTFSLTPAVSADIDRLSLVTREFRVSRSEVVKAGIEALKALSEDELVNKLKQVKQLT